MIGRGPGGGSTQRDRQRPGGVTEPLFDALEPRIVRRADGGLEIDIHMRGDDRPVAHLIVHEDRGTKLFRKLSFSLSTRQDERVRKDYWSMALSRAQARLLRG